MTAGTWAWCWHHSWELTPWFPNTRQRKNYLGMDRLLKPESPPRWLIPSNNVTPPSPSKISPPTRDQALKYMSPWWGAVLIPNTTGRIPQWTRLFALGWQNFLLYKRNLQCDGWFPLLTWLMKKHLGHWWHPPPSIPVRVFPGRKDCSECSWHHSASWGLQLSEKRKGGCWLGASITLWGGYEQASSFLSPFFPLLSP